MPPCVWMFSFEACQKASLAPTRAVAAAMARSAASFASAQAP